MVIIDQSAVIPYRKNDDGSIEILLVTTREGNWTIPKGIIEKDLSPRTSAAKEALEEAGIEGEVAETALGSYSCEKWGATCTVAVYPMKVTRVIAEEEWQENHRGRQWVSPEKAIRQLKQKELGPLVEKLAAML